MITARNLCQVDHLGLMLVAGRQGATRDIAWAHAIELADPTPYLSGGELVMTTGINIGVDTGAQAAYVARLAAAGVSALAVDTGTTLSEVPSGVLAAGDAHGVPVLRVPASTPFIAIARVVIDAVKADQLRAVQHVVDRQEVLARATLRGGIPGVVGTLAECLSSVVVAVGADGRVLATGGTGDQRLISALAESATRGGCRAAAVVSDGDALLTIQRLRAGQAVRGHLVVRTVAPLSDTERLLVAHAVSLISLALEKPARVVDAEQRLRSAVTRELLAGHGTVDDGVLRYFGFDPADEVTVVVLDGVGPVLAAEDSLGRSLAGTGPYLMTASGADIAIVLPVNGSRDRIDTVLAGLVPSPGGGASRPVPLTDIGAGLQQARMAAQSGTGSFTSFGDLGPLGFLLDGRSPSELRMLSGDLDSLEGQDGDLIRTLAVYLRHNGQTEAAAAELRIHRHTMRNRMRRIRVLLGDDLSSADSRTRLWLAVKARQLLQSRPPPAPAVHCGR
ncbi:PucR family transcriptional regulator ligand-binding domain-containing protein [Mycobacterium sp. SMC-8]|uniref:PucR family transcriptional regulator n=1 Tax=Mycobacterium sp. SMC-8 TaxID=2857060 RepID=UPI00220A2FAE|nr:PucR family transcriptional regulator ligand-binding domain-containing protein [Mycobacterium sp. SMC-8]